MVTLSIREAAKALAESNREMDKGTCIAKYFPSDNNIIRILEVSSSVASTGTVEEFLFDKDEENGIPYSVSMILLSVDEWKDVQSKKLHLPEDWDLQQAEDLFK
ncbi:MAG: hypothetical protein J6T06_13760 [Victivallales bacterium]|nr:hypothetical protein [Victivallales bacterium]